MDVSSLSCSFNNFISFFLLQYVLQTFDFPHAPAVQKMAAKIVSHISSFHFSAIFNKVSFRYLFEEELFLLDNSLGKCPPYNYSNEICAVFGRVKLEALFSH
jgi:hypothetical protein